MAGESKSHGSVDHQDVARDTIRGFDYTDPSEPFNADSIEIIEQSEEISQGLYEDSGIDKEQGTGDRGIMSGYASNDTHELTPLPRSLLP